MPQVKVGLRLRTEPGSRAHLKRGGCIPKRCMPEGALAGEILAGRVGLFSCNQQLLLGAGTAPIGVGRQGPLTCPLATSAVATRNGSSTSTSAVALRRLEQSRTREAAKGNFRVSGARGVQNAERRIPDGSRSASSAMTRSIKAPNGERLFPMGRGRRLVRFRRDAIPARL